MSRFPGDRHLAGWAGVCPGNHESAGKHKSRKTDPEEFTLKLTSEPFPVRGYKRLAVQVVDVYGNESVVVRDR